MARSGKVSRDGGGGGGGGVIVILFLLLLSGTFFYIFMVSYQDMNLVNKDYLGLRTHSIEKKVPRASLPPQSPPKQAVTQKHIHTPHAEFPNWELEHYTPIHVKYSKNPVFDLCRLDFKSYYEAPHAFPMFKDFVQKSKCVTHQKSYSALMEEIQQNKGTPAGRVVPPTGFVFHESRVGSTLVANMLASNPWAMVYSESSTGHDALLSCPGCSREDHIRYFQQVVTMMGRSPVHEMLFFKFQSSTVTAISIALEAFPDVPWIFLYRHPVQTMVSHLLPRGARGKLSKNAPCLRSMHHESPALAAIMNQHVPTGTNTNDLEPWCASHLNVLCESAMSAYELFSIHDQIGQRGALINYDSIPGIFPKIILPLFQVNLTSKWLKKMTEESAQYSKSRTVGKEFSGDSEDKDERATEEIVHWADKILQPSYDIMDRNAKIGLQRLLDSRESLRRLYREEKRVLDRDLSEGISAMDWSQWKEMPTHLEEGLEEELLVEDARDMEINPRKLLPLTRFLETSADQLTIATGDVTNRIDPVTGRIEVGLHADGVNSIRFEEIACPDTPDSDYPRTYDMKDLLENWNPDDTTVPPFHYNSLCYFDFQTDLHKAINYRQADVPYILYNVPEINKVVDHWKSFEYLSKFFGSEKLQVDVSVYRNHFLYFKGKDIHHQYHNRTGDGPWVPPTNAVEMTFQEWYETVMAELEKPYSERTFYYLQAKGMSYFDPLFQELSFFHPDNHLSSNFLHNRKEIKGIHCRFGMPGVVAEAHYDGHLNMAGAFGGIRRWILAHPNQCDSLYLHPRGHPSGRHSEFDWATVDYSKYPKFQTAQANEVIITGGMVLYLPSNWFHYIVSLNLNFQCNIRSGRTSTYDQAIQACGF